MTRKKTWTEKLHSKKPHEVKTVEKRFADIPEGSKMLIASPAIIDEYVGNIPAGKQTDIATLRNDLAIEYHADKTCPVTTGIFLRIVAEAAHEQMQRGKSAGEITPFWRVINSSMPIAKKLSFGTEFIEKQRNKEGIGSVPKD